MRMGVLGLCVGCAAGLRPGPGSLEADRMSLVDSSALAHISHSAPVLDHEVRSLFDRDEDDLTTPPDPTGRMESIAAAHAALPELGSAGDLAVMTYNLGLLDFRVFGYAVQSPALDARRGAAPAMLFELGHDVLLLQEVWRWRDVDVLAQEAHAHGYVIWPGTPDRHEEHGLVIAVRAERIGGGTVLDEGRFAAQQKVERWPGPGVPRGWLSFGFHLAGTDQHITFYNTHATAHMRHWRIREQQARELGAVARAQDGLVVLGGDLNSPPFYGEDVWMTGMGRALGGGWNNAVAWGVWQHYGGVTDIVAMVAGAEDVKLQKRVPQDWTRFLYDPYGSQSWCAHMEGSLFTATDCNTLYFEQYAGEEPPARLDHLMLRDPGGHVRVEGVKVVLHERHALGNGDTVEPSDHYGLVAHMRVAR